MNTETVQPPHEHAPKFEYKFLDETNKEQYRDAVLELLKEYPDNFFTGLFEEDAMLDYEKDKVVVSINGGKVTGCLFFNTSTNECNWLAVSKQVEGSKGMIAKKLFQTVFDSVLKGTTIFWYVNAEDAVFEGKPVGASFEPARKLYRDMGATLTKVENKFGEGNHAYLAEVTT